jgi:hypothetical protein
VEGLVILELAYMEVKCKLQGNEKFAAKILDNGTWLLGIMTAG